MYFVLIMILYFVIKIQCAHVFLYLLRPVVVVVVTATIVKHSCYNISIFRMTQRLSIRAPRKREART